MYDASNQHQSKQYSWISLFNADRDLAVMDGDVLKTAAEPLDKWYTMQWYASAVSHAVALCLSVRPSVTSLCSIKMAKSGIMQTTPHNSLGAVVFLKPKILMKFEWGNR